jgi:hypothetical protein
LLFAPFCGHINFVLTTFSPLQNNKLPALFETRKEIIKGSSGHNGIYGLNIGHLISHRAHRVRREKLKKQCDLCGLCERKGEWI